MVAPALATIGKEFDITSSMEQVLVMSIFLLAYAVGPFVLGPLSEIFGRVAILQLANLFYLVFNTACGFAQTKQQILAFRFLSGLGGSAPQAETYAPKLLANKAKKLRQSTGNNALRTKWEMENSTFSILLRKSLVRPFIMLGTQPTIQALALYRAYLYGLMYLV
ncbi:hypothetical protein RJZ90_005653 [Blastomyces dermatitidis]